MANSNVRLCCGGVCTRIDGEQVQPDRHSEEFPFNSHTDTDVSTKRVVLVLWELGLRVVVADVEFFRVE